MWKTTVWLLARWWIAAAAIIAVLAFIQAGIEREVTMQDGLVALCVSTVLLIEAIRKRQGLMILGGIGVIASSYLWVANGDASAPFDLQLLALLGLLFIMAMIAGFGLMLPSIGSSQSWSGVVMIAVFVLLMKSPTLLNRTMLADDRPLPDKDRDRLCRRSPP